MKMEKTLPKKTKRHYKSPRKRRDPRYTDPLFDITYFETGKRKKCYACPDLLFVSDVDYLFHLEEAHEGQRMHCCICSQCGKTFGSTSELQQHALSKCGTQPRYTCKVCGSKLMSAGSLYTHMLLHGDCNYTCNFCGKQFHNVHHLKAHERTHTKAALYTCEVCGKGFSHRQSIITHSSLHTGIKPYSCEHCGKGFSCISNLLKHRKTHASTCGALPLTSHRVKNAETKMRIKMNTPATVKQKNYSQFKMNELNEKRTVNAVRLLSKKRELMDDISTDAYDAVENSNIKHKAKFQRDVPNKSLKNKRTVDTYGEQKHSADVHIIKHETDVKSSNINSSRNSEHFKGNFKSDVVLKEELYPDADFDSDDSIPLSVFIASLKNEITETIAASANECKFNTCKVSSFHENNVNNQNITCNLCTFTFQSKCDFDLHMKNHSAEKLHIKYVEGFEENDFNDNDDDFRNNIDDTDSAENNLNLLRNVDHSEHLVLNKTTKRKSCSTNLERVEKYLIKRRKVSATRKKESDQNEHLRNKNFINNNVRSKLRKSRTSNVKKATTQSLQEGIDVTLPLKKEDVSDLEDTSVKIEENVNQFYIDKAVNSLLHETYNDGKKFECKTSGAVLKSRKSMKKHQVDRGFKTIFGRECADTGNNTIRTEKRYTYNKLQKEFVNKDIESLDNIPIMSKTVSNSALSENKIKQVKERQKLICSVCGTLITYQKWMQKHQMGKGYKNEAGEECAGPSLSRPQIVDTNPNDNDVNIIYVAKERDTVKTANYMGYKQFVENKKKNRKVQCEICKKTFSRMCLLKKHQNNKFNKDHSSLPCATLGSKTVRKCELCPLYIEKKSMKEHKKSIHADILTCDICNNIFSKPEILSYHRMSKHKLASLKQLPKRNYIYVCDKCGALYKHKSSLQEHERTGCSSGPLFQCEYCDARLHNIYTLKTHMAKHVEEKRHLCTFCGMKFMMKVQLKNHLYKHTGEKPFKCKFCPKAFAHSTSLDTHTSIHTGIKRYICLACGKRFSCYGNLDKHKASKNCKEWYNLNGEKKKMRILDEKPITNSK